MIPGTSPAPGEAARTVAPARVAWLASVVFCGVLPALVLIGVVAQTFVDGSAAIDFRQFYRAADAMIHGVDPYPGPADVLTASGRPYVYPPFPALVAAPLTVLPLHIAEALVMMTLVGAALAVPFVLGVRDWRCYGLVLLWPPVLSAVQTGNPTLLLALAAALAWRYRDRTRVASASVGVTLATKFLLWPLVVWLAATRRLASAALACAVATGLLLGSWAAIGFTGFVDYPDLLDRLEDTVGKDAYTIYIVGLDLGLPQGVARGLWLATGLAVLATLVVVARQGKERAAFILAIAAALALSPLVWLHYFALLVVVVAVARPRLGALWFVPLAMFLSPGTGDPQPLETGVALAVAALTIALALREAGGLRDIPSSEESVVPMASAGAT